MTSENRPTRILFNGHDFKFLKPVISHYQKNPSYEVLIDEHKGHVITDTRKSEELLNRTDIVFCEWCLGNAEWYSKNKKKHQVLVIRLHHQEIGLSYLDRIKWDNVDSIIFICQNNMKLFLEKLPFVRSKAVLIYNLFDCNTLNEPKLYSAEFNLGVMGTSPKRKAPHLAFEILKRLKAIDSRYTLCIKGKHPWEYDWLWRKPEERQYYETLYSEINNSEYANSVVFDPQGNDVPQWFSKIGFLLSTSDHEGSHQAIAEGMASGAIPVIRNWDGADLLYPPKYVFGDIDEAVNLILKWKTDEYYLSEAQTVKEFAQANFDNAVILNKYDKLLALLRNPEAKKEHFVSQRGASHAEKSDLNKVNDGHITAMHVCYLNPLSQSGYETRIIEETHLLKRLGISPIIACFIKKDYPYSKQQLSEFQKRLETYTGAEVYIYPTSHYFDLVISPDVTKEILDPLVSLAKRHKVGIIHGQALYSTMHALRANQRIGAKVTFDVHGASPEESEMSNEHAKRASVLTEWEKEALNRSDMRIFVSKRMKRYFEEKYGLPELSHAIIPCCVHTERFAMTRDIRENKRNLLGFKDKFVLMYLGTLSVWQWPEAMFSIFSQLHEKRPNSVFYLLLPEADHKKAHSFIDKHHLPTESYRIEEVPHSKVGSVVGVADAAFLLRKSHPVNIVSSPTKFGEYMASGVPVIATDEIGDTSELVRLKKVGIILEVDNNKLDPANLAFLMDFSREVQQNWQMWSNRCVDVAQGLLNWEPYSKVLSQAYKNLQ